MLCSMLSKNNLFVLYEGRSVTIYHSKSNDTETKNDLEMKTALSLAKYIVQVENLENNSISYLSKH